jgi:protein TonB
MTERVVSLRLTVIADGDRGSQRLSYAAVVVLVSLAHAILFIMAVRGTDMTHPTDVPPAPISVRWAETTVDMPPPAPPKVEPTPSFVPKQEMPLRRQTVQRPLPRQSPAEGAPHLSSAPPKLSPAEEPVTDAPQTQGRGREEQAVTPPRADAAYLSNPAPDYPSEARRAHQEGKVLLRVLVTADGQAEEVSLDRGCGYPLLDDAATDAVRKWRFTPARRGDTAVDAWALIPISFKLRTS